MKQNWTNNWGLKLLAVVSAILIWLVIMNNNDPVTTFTVNGIPIEFINEEVLAQNNMVYEIMGNKSVSVSVTTRTRDKSMINAADFKATADLNNIYDLTSNVEVKVELVGEDASLVRSWQQVDYTAKVITEDIVTRDFKIEVVQEGEVEDGYDYRRCTLSSATVALTAPRSKLNSIGAVKAIVDVSQSSESSTLTVPLTFYNDAGREIKRLGDMGVTAEMTEVDVDVMVQKTSPVSLDVVVLNKDQVAEGYRYITYRISDQSISVIGTMQSVAGLDKIQIEVDAVGAAGEVKKEIDIREYLPENVTVAGDDYMITVSLVVEPEGTVEFEVPSRNIDFVGNVGDWRYYAHQRYITVSVFGLKSDWEGLKAEDIRLVCDVTGLEIKDYILTLTATPIDGLEITVVDEINLTILGPEEETEGSTEETESSGETDETGESADEPTTEDSVEVGGTEAEDGTEESTESKSGRNKRW